MARTFERPRPARTETETPSLPRFHCVHRGRSACGLRALGSVTWDVPGSVYLFLAPRRRGTRVETGCGASVPWWRERRRWFPGSQKGDRGTRSSWRLSCRRDPTDQFLMKGLGHCHSTLSPRDWSPHVWKGRQDVRSPEMRESSHHWHGRSSNPWVWMWTLHLVFGSLWFHLFSQPLSGRVPPSHRRPSVRVGRTDLRGADTSGSGPVVPSGVDRGVGLRRRAG